MYEVKKVPDYRQFAKYIMKLCSGYDKNKRRKKPEWSMGITKQVQNLV